MFFEKIIKFKISHTIHHPINLCYQVVKNVKDYPKFISNVKSVKINQTKDKYTNYDIIHNFKLISDKDKINYCMYLHSDKIDIYADKSKYLNYINYNWYFQELNENLTRVNLKLKTELINPAFYPLVLTFSDLIKEKTMNEYLYRINYLKYHNNN